MGCFSYKCVECGKGIRSNSFNGERCCLFLLEKGKVLHSMIGEYNSYGSVFSNQECSESLDWPEALSYLIDPKDLGYTKTKDIDLTTGIAAVHESCFKKYPKIISVRDPNQGWGEEGECFSSTSKKQKYHKLKPIKKYNILRDHWLEIARHKYNLLTDRIATIKLLEESIFADTVTTRSEVLLEDKKLLTSKMKTYKITKKDLK